MIAIILAAGRGERLGKLTADKPKCLLELGEETVLDYQIRLLVESGIKLEDIYIVGGYKAELILKKYDNVIINNRYYNTDNSYSLNLALQVCADKSDSILVLDGDLVFDIKDINTVINSSVEDIILVCENGNFNSTGVIENKSHIAVEIGKHIKNYESVYANIFKVSSKNAKILQNELAKEENYRKWYTVPLNNCLSKIQFLLIKTEGMICEINDYFEYIKAKEVLGINTCKILLTGASGFLGKKIYSTLSRDYQVIKLSKQKRESYWAIDLLSRDEIYACIELNRPDIIIHSAAIADPDVSENNNDEAYALNVTATKNLCDVCRDKNIKMIYISTDYVFDGDSDNEYLADSQRYPKNYYGYTKLLAEDIVSELDEYLIIRIPIIYGYNDNEDKKTFLTDTISKLENNEELYLDNVQVRYPTLADEVAYAIQKTLWKKGIIQISSKHGVTKYEWAKIIAKSFDLNEQLVHQKNGVLPQNRPLHIKMETKSIDDAGIKISDIEEGTDTVYKQMNCIFKLIYKSDCTNNIYGVNVGEFRYTMGQILGRSLQKELVDSIDCVIPIPTSGLYYAMGLADAINKPYIQGLVKKDTSTRSFNIADFKQREDIIKSKIIPIKELVENKSVILVDEAIFTGTTMRIICDMLKACNVKSIHICIPTPVSFKRCNYYVQPDRRLLSEIVNAEDLANFFRVDSAYNLPYESFMDILMHMNKPMCFTCFLTELNHI